MSSSTSKGLEVIFIDNYYFTWVRMGQVFRHKLLSNRNTNKINISVFIQDKIRNVKAGCKSKDVDKLGAEVGSAGRSANKILENEQMWMNTFLSR